jgi:hypothetical protein
VGDSIDAAVTSTDLGIGEIHVWRDSVSANETGHLDHIFWADFRPEFGSRHRIEVTRSDGESSFVEVDVPGPIRIKEIDTRTRYLLVTIEGENVRLIRFDVTYGVRLYDAEADTMGPSARYTFSRTGEALRRTEGWRVDINLDADYESAKSSYYTDHQDQFDGFVKAPECMGLGLFEMNVSLTVGSADWDPPGGVFDSDVLSHPEAMTNVENGLGFVAAGYDEERTLHPSAESIEDSWFFDFIQERRPTSAGCGT